MILRAYIGAKKAVLLSRAEKLFEGHLSSYYASLPPRHKQFVRFTTFKGQLMENNRHYSGVASVRVLCP
jgi:hypothetical protein